MGGLSGGLDSPACTSNRRTGDFPRSPNHVTRFPGLLKLPQLQPLGSDYGHSREGEFRLSSCFKREFRGWRTGEMYAPNTGPARAMGPKDEPHRRLGTGSRSGSIEGVSRLIVGEVVAASLGVILGGKLMPQ